MNFCLLFLLFRRKLFRVCRTFSTFPCAASVVLPEMDGCTFWTKKGMYFLFLRFAVGSIFGHRSVSRETFDETPGTSKALSACALSNKFAVAKDSLHALRVFPPVRNPKFPQLFWISSTLVASCVCRVAYDPASFRCAGYCVLSHCFPTLFHEFLCLYCFQKLYCGRIGK